MCFLYRIFSLYRMCSLARAQTLVASKWPRVDDFTTHFTTHFNTQFTTYFTTQRGNDVHGFTRYTDFAIHLTTQILLHTLLHWLLHTLLHSAEMTYAELQEELPFPTKLVTVALPGQVALKKNSMCSPYRMCSLYVECVLPTKLVTVAISGQVAQKMCSL